MRARVDYRVGSFRSAQWVRRFVAVGLIAGWTCGPAPASDHADGPEGHGEVWPPANLTDLHAFVVGTDLVIALSSNPAIAPETAEYSFPPNVTFDVHLDNHSEVIPDDPYLLGGTIVEPSRIRSDLTFRFRFDEEGTPHAQVLVHGGPVRAVELARLFAGLRDDPFIRGPRQGRNVASVVFEVPLAAVTTRQSTLLIWATSKMDGLAGAFQDMVGGPLRSMMPENSEMNRLSPRLQEKKMETPPDVLIYNTAAPAAFPNGRALADDVVDLVNDPRILANDAPYPATNDVPFLNTFPYLAPPHPPR